MSVEMTTDVINANNDFGFSFEDQQNTITDQDLETLNKNIEDLQGQLKDVKEKNRQLMKKITSFLNKLKASPEKPVINWPNRTAEVEKFLKELNDNYKEQ